MRLAKTPVIHVYGISDSGKTQLVERLLLLLIQKGHRVGTVKLSRAESLDLDIEGKDTERHARSGSMAIGATSASNAAVFLPRPQRLDKLVEMMAVAGELDLVIVEGLGDDTPDSAPKVSVGEVKGVVPGTVVQLPGPDAEIGALLHVIDRVMAKKTIAEAAVELRVAGDLVPIKPFVQEYLEGTVRGAVGALRHEGRPGDSIELRIPRRAEGEEAPPPRSLDIE